METFFGVERPAEVCQARIDVKLRTPTGRPSPGRPIAVWQGDSNADEADVQEAINKHPSLLRRRHRRKVGYGTDGATLLARLTYFNDEQVLGKYDIDLLFLPPPRRRQLPLSEFDKALLLARWQSIKVTQSFHSECQKLLNQQQKLTNSLLALRKKIAKKAKKRARNLKPRLRAT